MTTYAVHRRTDGAEVYRYTANAVTEWGGYEFVAHTHDPVADPDAPPPPPAPTEWTRVEFLLRMTPYERIAVRAKAKEDAFVDDFMQLMEMAPTIRSDNANVRRGLGYLVMLGALTAERMSVILGDTA